MLGFGSLLALGEVDLLAEADPVLLLLSAPALEADTLSAPPAAADGGLAALLPPSAEPPPPLVCGGSGVLEEVCPAWVSGLVRARLDRGSAL